MIKVLFLDIDGVLNTEWWYTQLDKNTPKDKYGYAFDPNSVANLKKILDETGAVIVISSSWKSFGFVELEEMWSNRSLPGRIIDITPNSISDQMLLDANLEEIELIPIRGFEIKEWIETKGKGVSNYAIIDDMNNILPEQYSHFVEINSAIGITNDNAERAISILNNQKTNI